MAACPDPHTQLASEPPPGEEADEDLDLQQEKEHLQRVVNAFLYYR